MSHTRIEMVTMESLTGMAHAIRQRHPNPVVGVATNTFPNGTMFAVAVRADGQAYQIGDSNKWYRLPDVPDLGPEDEA